MHLSELSGLSAVPAGAPAPEWMRGCFRRRSISFANGQTDTDTRVFWLQSRRLTIDLRLPTPAQQQADAGNPESLADYEGWYADAIWDGKQLSWDGGASYQLHNRWPEPAILQRTGNCMMEFAPSGIYVEDWRLQSDQPGPLIGLELVSEKDLHSGRQYQRRGALIIAGRYAGLVLDRPQPVSNSSLPLKHQLLDSAVNADQRTNLLAFETSVAEGSLSDGFRVSHSLHASRLQQPLLSLEGFAAAPRRGYLLQHTGSDGQPVERLYRIDCYETEFPFSAATPSAIDSLEWFAREAPTLTRYTRMLYQD